MKRLLLLFIILNAILYGYSQQISSIEYFIDNDPGFGNATPVSITADTEVEASFNIDLTPYSEGFHNLYLRSKNSNGVWGMTAIRTFYKQLETTTGVQITNAEYFIDTDPGYGNATVIPVSASNTVETSFEVDLSSLDNGFHKLYLRSKNSEGVWGMTSIRTFYKQVIEASANQITAIEYFIDTDPGIGSATSVPVSASNSVETVFDVDLSSLDIGFHKLYIRSRNSEGTWGITNVRTFYKQSLPEQNDSQITAIEYFIDTDPGIGNGNELVITSANQVEQVFDLDVSSLSRGEHQLFVRAKNTENIWSFVSVKDFCVGTIPSFDMVEQVCVNSLVTITDQTTNIGTNTTYAWDFDGDGVIDATTPGTKFRTFTSVGDYEVSLTVSDDGGCSTTYTKTISVQNEATPSISLYADQTTICDGEYVNFTTNTYYGGNEPTYKWYVNNIELEGRTFDTLQINTLSDEDVVECELISDYFCLADGASSIVRSNGKTITVNPILSPNVTLNVVGGTMSAGETPEFYLDLENCGSNPTYDWMINGSPIGVTTSTFTMPGLTAGMEISCEVTVTGGVLCLTSSSDISNSITVDYSDYAVDFIVEDQMGELLENANINIAETTIDTDVSGLASLSLSSGQYNYTVSKIGYSDVSGNLTVNGENQSVNIVLTTCNSFCEINAEICDNESYLFGTTEYSEAGTYYETIPNFQGCDSIITLNLSVHPTYLEEFNVAICNGESYEFEGTTYTESGYYVQNYPSVNFCDSILALNLTVNPSYNESVYASICEGDTYEFSGETYTETGVYEHSLISVNGCDSIVTLNLTVNSVFEETVYETICEGNSFTLGESTFTDAGIYTETLTSQSGCDSVIHLNLSVNPSYNEVVYETICEGFSFEFQGEIYSETGFYTHNLVSYLGCDSIISLDLTVNPTYNVINTVSICEGENYDFFGETFSETGTHTHNLTSINGCDSIITLELTVNPSYNETVTISICEGEFYEMGTETYTEAGVYTQTLTSISGCDSIVNLNLTINPNYLFEETHTICQGSFYNWHGDDYTETGLYTAEYTTSSGCDSIYQLELTVSDSYETFTTEAICEGEELEWRGNIYTEEDIYTETLTSETGCDSIFILELTVNPLPQQVIVLNNPSNGILDSGNTGEIKLSTSYSNTEYWVTMGSANFTGMISGTGNMLSLGTSFPAGTYDIWSSTEFGCETLQGSVSFVEDNGGNNLTANITFGSPAMNFPTGEAIVTLYKQTTDIEQNEVIVFDQQQTLGGNGQAVFEDLEPGDYYLGSALVNPDNYNVSEHIYYQTAITHENAISIPMTENTIFIADLHHPQLVSEDGSNSSSGVVGEGGTKSDLAPLANMVVILRNVDTDEIIDVSITNSSGEYNFPSIPDNTNIQMYVTSLEHQEWTPFSVHTEIGVHYEVDFLVDDEQVYPDGTVNANQQSIPDIHIYPNPTIGKITIEADGLEAISIFMLDGRLIDQKVINANSVQIDLSSYAKGTYLIKAITKNGMKLEKIILK